MNSGLLYRMLLVLGLTVLAVLFLLPSIFGAPPLSFLPSRGVKLGLDLQGGTHLIMSVDTDKAVASSVERSVDEVRSELRKANVRIIDIKRTSDRALRVSFPNEAREQVQSLIGDRFSYLEVTHSQTEDANATLELTLSESEARQIKESSVEQSLETIRNRIDQFGVSEPIIQRQGERDILIQLPGITDPERAKELIGRTAVLEFKLLREGVSGEEFATGGKPVPPGTALMHGPKLDANGKRLSGKGSPYVVETRTLMTGDVLTDARVQTGQVPGTWVVAFTLDRRGARTFEELTEANIGRRLAIVLDGVVDSAPVIKGRIPGGQGIIEGNFDIEEARDLAIVLRVGALPAPVTVAEERTVGPSLGKDSIRQGFLSFIVGGSLVIVFMVIYYRLAGLLADMALILNVVFIFATLAALEATLTLPGIAGIVLTLGMAVDANVLINERIREELRLGKSARAAIEAGYDRALPAILDSNITTFLSGAILFQFGSGPIKGFAVTLCVGLVTSVFTAVVATRVVYDYLLSQRRLQTVSI